jgi:hypothetical protein
MLEGTPVPAVIPVPASDALVKAPCGTDAASSDPEPADAPAEKEEEEKAAGKTAGRRGGTRAAKSAEAKTAPESGKAEDRKKTAARGRKRKDPAGLDEAQLERLRKLAPKSVKKMVNTLSTQFKTPDAEAAVNALSDAGIFVIAGEKIIWPE